MLRASSAADLGGRATPLWRPGKVVLVDFWATWCESCKVALPLYARLYQELRGRGFEVVAVSVDDDDAAVRAYLEKAPLPFPVLRDPGGALGERLGLSEVPTSFLVGRDGSQRARYDGFKPEVEPALRAELARALAKGN